MVAFKPILRQLTLFDYETMRLRTRIPIKRISRERMEQAMKEMKAGKEKNLVIILQDINEALSNYNNRLSNKRKP